MQCNNNSDHQSKIYSMSAENGNGSVLLNHKCFGENKMQILSSTQFKDKVTLIDVGKTHDYKDIQGFPSFLTRLAFLGLQLQRHYFEQLSWGNCLLMCPRSQCCSQFS